jgi:hypothetical protein
VEAEAAAVLACTGTTGGLTGKGSVSFGASGIAGKTCGRSSGIAISNPATAH